MLELRRIRAGIFEEDKSQSLYEIEDAVKKYKDKESQELREMIIPGEIISELFPIVNVKKEVIDKLFHGSPLFKEWITSKGKFNSGDKVCVFSGDKFIGVFKVGSEDKIFARPEFVLQPIKN